MSAAAPTTRISTRSRLPGWLPVMLLPTATVMIGADWPGWQLMWVLALAIYAGMKWLTLADFIESVDKTKKLTLRRCLGYLLLWPGMDPRAFFADRFDGAADEKQKPQPPRPAEWFAAMAKMSAGAAILGLAVPMFGLRRPMADGWLGVIGILLLLHFGLLHLISAAWRAARVDARPIMNAPLCATSVADFWGHRWNLAFRDLAHAYVFRPLVGRCGIAATTLAVFAVSGLVHEAVISLPARGGWGGPTIYFLIQGAGIFIERTRTARRMGLGRGALGRVFAAAVLLAPLGLLCHRPFLTNVILPMLTDLGLIGVRS